MDISLGLLDTNSTFVNPILRNLNSRSDSTILSQAVQNIANASNAGVLENEVSSQQFQNELFTNNVLDSLLTGTESEDSLAFSLFDLESLAAGSLPLESGLQDEIAQANQNIFQVIANTAFSENTGNSLFSELFSSGIDLESDSAAGETVFSTDSGTQFVDTADAGS